MTRLLLPLLFAPLLAGCPDGASCSSVFGPAGFSVTISGAEAGTYTWGIDTGESVVTCEGHLPDGHPDCDDDSEPIVEVSEDGTWSVSTWVDSDPVDVVTVWIEKDDVPLVDEEVEPEWAPVDDDACKDLEHGQVELEVTEG